jgi:amidase
MTSHEFNQPALAPHTPSLTELHDALRAGQLSAATLAARTLAAIAASTDTLNAFSSVRDEEAIADAQAADRRLANGEASPLLGIPVAIKDDMHLAGYPTTLGCPGIFPAQSCDSEAVRRLKAAGAIIVGKTTTPELCQWPITKTSTAGSTRNPWNLDHTPGGSSGGAAAAVAAGIVPAALGSDAAGSIRIPAAWTHLVGLKPQRDRVPTQDACYGLISYGPLTRTVADAAAMLDALAATPADCGTTPFTDAARREPAPLRIAVSFRAPFTGHRLRLDPRIRTAIESLADTLTDLGHQITTDDPSYGLCGASLLPRAMAALRDLSRSVPDKAGLDARSRAAIRTGRYLSPLVRPALAIEPALRHQIGRIFNRYDLVLTPTTALPPPTHEYLDGQTRWQTDKLTIEACPYAWAWNVTGWPAINIPAAILDGGLPVGASLLGPPNSEQLLLSVAAQIENVRRWHRAAPNYSVTAPRSNATCQR